jgi:hypothetical protein
MSDRESRTFQRVLAPMRNEVRISVVPDGVELRFGQAHLKVVCKPEVARDVEFAVAKMLKFVEEEAVAHVSRLICTLLMNHLPLRTVRELVIDAAEHPLPVPEEAGEEYKLAADWARRVVRGWWC